MRIVNKQPAPATDEQAELKQQIARMRELNQELSPRHVVWGGVVLGAISRQILKLETIDIRGT